MGARRRTGGGDWRVRGARRSELGSRRSLGDWAIGNGLGSSGGRRGCGCRRQPRDCDSADGPNRGKHSNVAKIYLQLPIFSIEESFLGWFLHCVLSSNSKKNLNFLRFDRKLVVHEMPLHGIRPMLKEL
nr:hypothetical protein Iba_chr09dCG15030 [Ipomoea batatas]GME13237.1 hypothetical protein Iba_scaffold14370CG0610 [Ipomoea batatas]GME19373.1 hypothetical protein Iba_scaffold22660CG0030 [Ipomoea batatas]